MGEIYHVFNKSIGEIEVFKNACEFLRMIEAICFYQRENRQIRFSVFAEQILHRPGVEYSADTNNVGEEKVEILAYCIMPTHFHLLLKELKEKGIASFINNLLNSYTRYFNVKYLRKGTLWEGPTKKVIAKTDNQFVHLTRYIHLNPVTAHIVDKPEEWPWSSYREYILESPDNKRICNYDSLMDMDRLAYKKFVEDGILYQRERARAKNANYTGPV